MNKIKELRKEKNITVAELAKELGISQSMLTNYENGNGTHSSHCQFRICKPSLRKCAKSDTS